MTGAYGIDGPVLVMGASGFIGQNLVECLSRAGVEVIGTAFQRSPDIRAARFFSLDLREAGAVERLFSEVRPSIIFNLVCHGNKHSQIAENERTFQTNTLLVSRSLKFLSENAPHTRFIQIGSSSEYGLSSHAPLESERARPNSLYGISKFAASQLVEFYGKQHHLPTVSLRLYSVYGPREASDRLIPRLLDCAEKGTYPPLADRNTPRDFLYVADACEALMKAAFELKPEHYGEVFNVGTGVETTLETVVEAVRQQYALMQAPTFNTYANHYWDLPRWSANPKKFKETFNWVPAYSLAEGLRAFQEWKRAHPPAPVRLARKRLSLIVACYNNAASLPELVSRSLETLKNLNCEPEIILVNDGSQDPTEALLLELSRNHVAVTGISHSRNFGSQAAFRSGMELMSGDACVLMDGDLQDPPEVIKDFFTQWENGYEVVFGVRASREEAWPMASLRKLFYRLFSWVSDYPIPLHAGDFSLLDRKVVRALLQCSEVDPFWRGLRAYVGFRQAGVPYHRPERLHGRSSNSFFSNLAWARKAIFSHGTRLGQFFFLFSIAALLTLFPFLAFTDLDSRSTLAIIFFALVQMAGLLLLNERIELVFKEVKRRPRFIRKSLTRGGLTEPSGHG